MYPKEAYRGHPRRNEKNEKYIPVRGRARRGRRRAFFLPPREGGRALQSPAARAASKSAAVFAKNLVFRQPNGEYYTVYSAPPYMPSVCFLNSDGETPKYFLKAVLKYLALSNPTSSATLPTLCPERNNAAARSRRITRMNSLSLRRAVHPGSLSKGGRSCRRASRGRGFLPEHPAHTIHSPLL